MFQGPSIREVQATVSGLREASLCVVELVQAWRRATRGHPTSESQDARSPTPAVSWGGVSGALEASPRNGSPDRPEQKGASTGGARTADGPSPEVRFPEVPTARPSSHFDEDLPVFWWLPPGTSGHENSTEKNPEASVPEQVGHDLNEDDPTPAVSTLKGPRHSDRPTMANQGTDPSGSDNASSRSNPPSAHEAPGVNYLARMATDTDFVGAPGSVLADFFPPDTKLYRNPFVLAHNLDDTLAVDTGGGGVSPRDRGHRDGGETSGSVSSSSAVRKSRLDTRRIRVASEIIVAEDTRERSSKRDKRRRAGEGREQEALIGDAAGKGSGVSFRDGAGAGGVEEAAASAKADGQRLDGDRGGSDKSSKKRKGKGGITFQDQHSEGRRVAQPSSSRSRKAEMHTRGRGNAAVAIHFETNITFGGRKCVFLAMYHLCRTSRPNSLVASLHPCWTLVQALSGQSCLSLFGVEPAQRAVVETAGTKSPSLFP